MKFGVLVFPGSNCDQDTFHVLSQIAGQQTTMLWHDSPSLENCDALVVPGGFAFGDYLRTGAIARFSPVMQSVSRFAAEGGPVLGICNGFQILCEAGLLPGALLRNAGLKYICKQVHLRIDSVDSIFTNQLRKGAVVELPIGHMEGNYYCDPETLSALEREDRVAFRYSTAAGEVTPSANPNGSLGNIAGILNERRNVLGMMPHPDRSSEALLGSSDGFGIFASMLHALSGLPGVQVTSMIDIHHHLLFGLDDGATDLETSVKMVEVAAQDGITHIVCTPHANHRFHFDREKNEGLLEEIRQRVGNKVTLGLGCDFHLSWDNIQDALDHPGRYTINGKKYLLVEFADTIIPDSINDSFFELTIVKQRPIITHPERNPVLQRHPERLAEWVRDGALVQVTASSLTGRFGRTAKAIAENFLDRNWVHFLATDAHNLESRPPVLSRGYEAVANRCGRETADRLCIHNPRAVFYGEELGPQPEATHLRVSDEWSATTFKKKGLFARLLSRR